MISGICRASVLPALAVPQSGLEKIWWFYYGLAHLRVSCSACQHAPRRKAPVKKPCSGLWNLNCSQFQLRDATVAFCCRVAIWTMTLLCRLKRPSSEKDKCLRTCDWVGIREKTIQGHLFGASTLRVVSEDTHASWDVFFYRLCFARPSGHASALWKATPYCIVLGTQGGKSQEGNREMCFSLIK